MFKSAVHVSANRLHVPSEFVLSMCRQNGYTALHRATAQGHVDVLQALVDEGCAVDRQDLVVGTSSGLL